MSTAEERVQAFADDTARLVLAVDQLRREKVKFREALASAIVAIEDEQEAHGCTEGEHPAVVHARQVLEETA